MREPLSPIAREALAVALRTRGVLPVAVGIGCAPDTLRRALNGRGCNGPARRKITAYLFHAVNAA